MHVSALTSILRVPCALALIAGLSLMSQVARAANVPGAELRVSRSASARACPDETTLAEQLRARVSARADSSEPMLLDVRIDTQGTAFVADLRVIGQKQGERSFRAEGPTCDALGDVLVVSLSLLLDEDDAQPPATRGPRVKSPSASELPSAWLDLGGSVTNAMPVGWSSAWSGELVLRAARWDFALGGYWSPSRTVTFAPGELALRAEGARARTCFALLGRELRFGACAIGALAVLEARSSGFSSDGSKRRPWWLLGAGPDLRWFPSRLLSLGIHSEFLIGLGHQSFSVEGLSGTAYRSAFGSFWSGLDCSVQIW